MRPLSVGLAASVHTLLLTALACSPGADAGATRNSEAESLGFVDFGASCDPSVRAEFERGVALFHHMTYPVARSTFERVTEQDPDCAMGYWGAAMTLFQPLWPTRPSDAELQSGWELIQEARRRGPKTPREEMFIAATESFFDPSAEPDYWARIERWAAATGELYEAFPEDTEARAFFALARLATASRFGAAADHHAEAHEVLASILEEQPTHPGAVHYTIHANDFDGRQDQSLDVVRRYGEIAPRNPHALHMPTHIFVRLGEWDEVISWNRRAAEAALSQRVGPNDEYVWDEFPHAVEYLVYAHLQQGDDAEAERAIRSIGETPDLQPGFKTAFHLASTASRFVLERKDWRAAAELPLRSPAWVDWDRFPWPEAVIWFARGLGAAHGGDGASVARSIDRLGELSVSATKAGEIPFATQIDILRLELSAWQAHRAGDSDAAIELMRQAIELEGATPKHPVTPGATLPANELLGDLYLEVGDAQRALESYRASNVQAPARYNTLLGMARASDVLRDRDGASRFYDQLLELAVDDSPREGSAEATAYLGR